jgi:hypothetical protein
MGKLMKGTGGPYKFETRVKILKMLLKAQKQIQETEKYRIDYTSGDGIDSVPLVPRLFL